jgi:hypothetical protein
MKNRHTIILLFSILTSWTPCFSQTTTTKITEQQKPNYLYDSTLNYLGENSDGYIGQDLYVKGLPEDLRKFGYNGFVIDYKKEGKLDNSNVFKCCDGFNSNYSDLQGKYFTVEEVIPHPKAAENPSLYAKKKFLKLREKQTGDIAFYEYEGKYDHAFPFLVVGFLTKAKKQVIDQTFVLSDNVLAESKEITSGNPLTLATSQKWKCVDLTVEQEFYNLALLIENESQERTTLPYNLVFGPTRKGKMYYENEVEDYTQRFGEELFDKILNGKVVVGMTKEMCQLSWGEPDEINVSTNPNSTAEQWVYENNYLYFSKDKLTAIE